MKAILIFIFLAGCSSGGSGIDIPLVQQKDSIKWRTIPKDSIRWTTIDCTKIVWNIIPKDSISWNIIPKDSISWTTIDSVRLLIKRKIVYDTSIKPKPSSIIIIKK